VLRFLVFQAEVYRKSHTKSTVSITANMAENSSPAAQQKANDVLFSSTGHAACILKALLDCQRGWEL